MLKNAKEEVCLDRHHRTQVKELFNTEAVIIRRFTSVMFDSVKARPLNRFKLNSNTASASITRMSHVCCACMMYLILHKFNTTYSPFPLVLPDYHTIKLRPFPSPFRAINSDDIRIRLRYLPNTSVDIRRQRSLADLKWRTCSHGPLVAWSK